MRVWLVAGMSSGIAVAILEAITLLLPRPDHPGLRPSPPPDILWTALEETDWGMSVPEVRASFEWCTLSRDRWRLEREMFRNRISCYVRNIKVSFLFAGIVADEGAPPLPRESALIEIEIGRTLSDEMSRREFPEAPLQQMSQSYARRLAARGVRLGRTHHHDFESPRWERIRSHDEVALFTLGKGIRVSASPAVLGSFLEQEKRAASARTPPWRKYEICGNDWVYREWFR
jgi:hypothetical protein